MTVLMHKQSPPPPPPHNDGSDRSDQVIQQQHQQQQQRLHRRLMEQLRRHEHTHDKLLRENQVLQQHGVVLQAQLERLRGRQMATRGTQTRGMIQIYRISFIVIYSLFLVKKSVDPQQPQSQQQPPPDIKARPATTRPRPPPAPKQQPPAPASRPVLTVRNWNQIAD